MDNGGFFCCRNDFTSFKTTNFVLDADVFIICTPQTKGLQETPDNSPQLREVSARIPPDSR
jgi:hypothetical protein